MKVQTNAGEVDLTAEMVRRGMVFQADNWIQKDARDGVLTLAWRDPGSGAWATTIETWCWPEHAACFLGCDPATASRADCERFGVHGDAGAYGFARLRGGGAVDLRQPENLVVGMRFQSLDPGTEDQRTTFLHSPNCMAHGIAAGHWCFLGLIPALVHPKDVRRLCCGQSRDPGSSIFCALAIGDHDMHEDLATGVRWAANKALFTPFAEAVLGLHVPEHHRQMANAAQDRLGASAKVEPTPSGFTIKTGTGGFLLPADHPDAVGSIAELKAIAAEKSARPVEWRFGQAEIGNARAHMLLDGDRCRWMVTYLGLRIVAGERGRSKVKEARRAAGEWLQKVAGAAEGIAWLGAFFGLLFRVYDASPVAKTAARDAAVAKAIADVPEGCDGQRWTHVVHVLAAFHEETVRARGRAQATADMVRHLAAARPVVAAYARLRFVAGYGVKEALARLPAEVVTTDTAARMCAAYEAGR